METAIIFIALAGVTAGFAFSFSALQNLKRDYKNLKTEFEHFKNKK